MHEKPFFTQVVWELHCDNRYACSLVYPRLGVGYQSGTDPPVGDPNLQSNKYVGVYT